MAMIKPPNPSNLLPIISSTNPSKKLTPVSAKNSIPFGFLSGSAYLALIAIIIERIKIIPITINEEKTSGCISVVKKLSKCDSNSIT